MDKIIVASYMGSGSSAVTDLLSEYENVSCPNGSYEYVFMHCPDGLFDLEDKLLVGNNALRSDEALRSFEVAMRELFDNGHWWFGGYRNKVSARFMDYVDEFISEITTASFSSFWYEQEKLSRSEWNANRVKKKLGAKHYDLLATQLRMAFPKPSEYYTAAHAFVEKTLSDVADDLAGKTLLLDQLLLPHNLWRAPRYFNEADTRIIVVSRDPRDVFALNKYVWSAQGQPVPLPLDVNGFCEYYKRMRKSEEALDSNMILRVRFEDLVFDYANVKARIENFVGKPMLGEHVRQKALFDPAVSQGNIGVYGFSAEAAAEAEVIRQNLEDYLYPIDNSSLSDEKIRQAF